MDQFNTALSAYGFAGGVPSDPSVKGETSVGTALDIPSGAALPKLPLHWDNPLFWVLILVLIFTGWVYGGFNLGGGAGIKKIGSAGGNLRIRGGRG